MRVFITGVQGFLGSAMAAEFRGRGWLVAGSARIPQDPSTVALALGEEPRPGVFAGYEVVIHGAYDPRAGLERNREGTRRIYAAAARDGVRRQIFLSSYSARPQAPSVYGRMKYELEQFFLAEGQTIVRPGMVTGGGMFEQLTRSMLRLPVAPVVDGGCDLVPLLDISDFARAMARIVDGDEGREFNLFAPRLLTSRRVAERVYASAGRRAVLVPVPAAVVIAAGTLGSWLRLVRFDAAGSARMARVNRVAAYESDLVRLIGTVIEPEEAIRGAIAQYGSGSAAVGR